MYIVKLKVITHIKLIIKVITNIEEKPKYELIILLILDKQ